MRHGHNFRMVIPYCPPGSSIKMENDADTTQYNGSEGI